jgi:hypothetical protein
MFKAENRNPAVVLKRYETTENLLILAVVLVSLTAVFFGAASGYKETIKNASPEGHLEQAVIAGDDYTVPLERDQFSDFAPLANDGFLVFQAPRDDTNAYLLCLERADGVVKAFTGQFDAFGFTPEKLQSTAVPALVARCEKDI